MPAVGWKVVETETSWLGSEFCARMLLKEEVEG
jgi:hypothetical protein